jgi:sugar phosphate isomerase/epimerase
MLIGTITDYAVKHFGMEKGLEIIAGAGFNSLDFSMFNYSLDEEPFNLPDEEFKKYFKGIAETISKNGLIVGQTHTPFPTYVEDIKRDEEILEVQAKSIYATSLLGSKYAIIHPAVPKKRKYDRYKEETKQINMERYLHLYEYLEKHDVYCCIENMFSRDSYTGLICPTTCSTAEEMVDYIDTLNSLTNSNRYCACLDIGHSNLLHYNGYETINAADMIKILGDRLKTLHVQDTDEVHDLHMPPGFGNIDFDDVCEVLKEVGYKGVFSLEADSLCYKLGKECVNESQKLMYRIAKKFIDAHNL